jgi:hypothetical protein
MKELIEYIAKAIVDAPDQVEVTEESDDRVLILHLKVAPEDMGKVIGKHGRIAQAMSTLLRVASIKQGTRTILEIG